MADITLQKLNLVNGDILTQEHIEKIDSNTDITQNKINENSNKIGDLSGLTTIDKDSIVDAINENTSQLSEKANQSALDTTNATVSGHTTQIANNTTNISSLQNTKADINYVNTKTQANNLSYKESYATLSALQTAYPSGDAYNHVVLADDCIYTWSNSAWTSTQVQANGTGIANKSVAVKNTTFFSEFTGKNLFNKNDVVTGYNYVNGILTANASYMATASFIPVLPSTTYSFTKILANVLFVCYDSNKTYLSQISVDTNTISTLTTPSNCYYIKIWTFANKSDWLDKIQFELGSVCTDYESYIDYKINSNAIDSIAINDKKILTKDVVYASGKNLFNKDDILSSYKISTTTGYLIYDTTYKATKSHIPVQSSTPYCLTPQGSAFVICFYDTNKVFISYVNITANSGNYFITPPTCKYIRFFVANSAVIDSLQIEKGLVNTTYESYKQYINDNILNISSLYKIMESGRNLFNKDDIIQGYKFDNSTGNLLADATMMVTASLIPVKPSTIYHITKINSNIILGFYDSTGAYLSYSSIDTNSVYIFTTPTNCYYLRIYTFASKASYLTSIQLEEGNTASQYESYGQKYIKPDFINPALNSRLASKVWNTLGDSITWYDYYQPLVKSRTGIKTVNNYGIGGTLLAKKADDSNATTAMCVRYANMDTNADIVTVMGGANDWSASIPFTDSGNKYSLYTIEGAMRTIIESLMTMYPTKNIIWLTCTPRLNPSFASQLNAKGEQMDNNGNTVEDMANYQIVICKEYNIPCIDLYHNVGWNRFNYSNYLMDDGSYVHPTQTTGAPRMASLIIDGFSKFVM